MNRFGGVFESLVRRLGAVPEAAELAVELGRLAGEIRALTPEYPLDTGVALAMRMTDGSRSAAAPLIRLAAEMIADHSGQRGDDLRDYLESLGQTRASGFLEELAAAIRTP